MEQAHRPRGGSAVRLAEGKFGLCWQIVPSVLLEMVQDPDPAKSQRVMEAMLQMKKIDIARLEEAYGKR